MGCAGKRKFVKMKQKFSIHQIPIARAESNILCPVYWLERLFARYPGEGSAMLLSTVNYQQISYSAFNKALQKLIAKAKN